MTARSANRRLVPRLTSGVARTRDGVARASRPGARVACGFAARVASGIAACLIGFGLLVAGVSGHATDTVEASSPSKGGSARSASDESASSGVSKRTSTNARSVPVYVPPRRGQPRARVGGGVRGPNVQLPTLQALVPDHVALTSKSRPTLLWHLDRLPPERASLMFSLTNESEIDPLIAVVLPRPSEAGLQRIDLGVFDYQLVTGEEYQWSVALVTDFEHRSRDLITFGWIERVPATSAPPVAGARTPTAPKRPGRVDPSDASDASDASGASGASDAGRLAARGLWYDAVAVADADERAALLEQIGLRTASAR